MVAIAPDLGDARDASDGEGDADDEAADARRQSGVVVRLDDGMQVILLDGEMQNAKRDDVGAGDRVADGGEEGDRTQRRDARGASEREQDWIARLVLFAPIVSDSRAPWRRRAARAGAGAAPGVRDGKLHLTRAPCHLESAIVVSARTRLGCFAPCDDRVSLCFGLSMPG